MGNVDNFNQIVWSNSDRTVSIVDLNDLKIAATKQKTTCEPKRRIMRRLGGPNELINVEILATYQNKKENIMKHDFLIKTIKMMPNNFITP